MKVDTKDPVNSLTKLVNIIIFSLGSMRKAIFSNNAALALRTNPHRSTD